MSIVHSSSVAQGVPCPVQRQDGLQTKKKALRLLLRLMLLVLTQQAITMVDVGAASSAVFKATTAAMGVLLLPQAAQAQVEDDRIIMPFALSISKSSTVTHYVDIRFSEPPKGILTITLTASDSNTLQLDETEKTYNDPNEHHRWPNHIGFPVSLLPDGLADKKPEVTLTFTFSGGGYDSVTRDVKVTIVDDDEVNLVASPSSLRIKEGSSARYALSLSKQPTSNVTVTIADRPSDSDVSVNPSRVIFTPGNWRYFQFVHVDTDQDPDRVDDMVTLIHQVSVGGAVNSASGSPFVVTVVDDEPGVRLSRERIEVEENETGTYAVVLHTKPTVNVTVTPDSRNKDVARVVPSVLTFTPSNWNVAQRVTVTGVENPSIRTENRPATVIHAVSGYGRVTAGSVTVIVKYNKLGVTVSKKRLTVNENASDIYTVRLNTQPVGGSVTVNLNPDNEAAKVLPRALTFTTSNWHQAQTVTVTGKRDPSRREETVPVTVSHGVAGADYGNVKADPVMVDVIYPPRVPPRVPVVTVAEGGTATYVPFPLNEAPRNTITVELSSDDKNIAKVLSPRQLTFSPTHWRTRQTVTVEGVEDDFETGDRTTTVSSTTTDHNGNKEKEVLVKVIVIDNDKRGVKVASPALTVREGASNTYTVKLTTEPVGGSVTVTPSPPSSNEPAAVSVSPSELTFTTSDWEDIQTVTVTGKKAVSTPVTVSHTATGADYDNVQESELGKVTVIVEESTLLPTPEGLAATAGNGQVTLTWDDPNDASITLWKVQYRKVGEGRWNTRWKSKPSTPSTPSTLTKTVTGLDNGSEYQFRIQAMNTIGQSQWSQTETATPRIVGGVTLEPKTMTITEGGTGRYTVVLDTRPAERVGIILNLEPEDESVKVLPSGLVFDQDDWNIPKTVTVTSVDDDIDTEEKNVKVRHTVTGYGDVGADDVTVVVTDNDIAGVTVKMSKTDPTAKKLTIKEGSTHSYEVVLDTQPESTVEVTPVSMNQNVVTVSPSVLTFTTGHWNIAKTVTLTGVNNDNVDTGTKTVELIHNVGSDYGKRGKGKPDPVTMTVKDDDIPPAKTEGLATQPGDGEMTLTWDDPNDASITLWQVLYATRDPGGRSSGGWKDITGSTATTTTHTVTGLQNGIEYSFSIRAKNHINYGEMAKPEKATPAAPTTTPKRVIVPSIVRVVEGASGQTKGYVDVLLRERPTDNVAVTASEIPPSNQLTVGNVSDLTPFEWDLDYKDVPIPIEATDNHETGPNSNAQLEVTVSGGGYSTVKTVEVEIIDDEANHLVVSHGDLKLQEDESASYAVSLSKRPTANVTVNIGGATGTGNVGLTVTPSTTLTFTTGNWDTRQTVTVTADDDIETSSVVKLTHVANASSGSYSGVSGGTVTVELDDGGGDSLPGSALTLAEETDHQDAARAAKARAAELAGTSRALLGMASDMLGVRITGAAAMGGGDGGSASLGDQAWGVVENLLGSNGNELPTDLDLEQIGERLWSQSFQITAAGGGDAQAAGTSSGRTGSWTLWGAGDLRSYRGEPEEHISFNGNLKTGWLGLDYGFNDQWLAGLAVSYSSGESDYSYRKTSGATDGGKLNNEVTSFYPYGSVQLSERFRLWGLAGFGFGSQHHQHNEGGDKAEGKLRLQMGVIGFTQQLNDVGALQLSLAGDVALARSTTDWPAASGLQEVEVSLSRARLGVDTRFPLTEQATGYVNVKGRLDGGELEMGAAEVLSGLHFDGGRFSGSLQGQQVYAFDGSYTESGLSAQLSFRTHPDGSGLAWELQPSYGYGAGEFALGGEQVSLWSDEQLEELTGYSSRDGQMELRSRMGYGIRLSDGERLLTPFTELRLGAGGSRSLGLGLSLSTPSWEVELSGTSEGGSGRAATGKVDLTFSKKL